MYYNLPAEIREQQAWVNVYKDRKVPMQVSEIKGASSVLPSTWGTFDAAVRNVRLGIYDGIGYVFHDTGLVGIDIDHGKTEDGLLSDEAYDIISHCCSYTEKSRSGRGFHILVRGSLPFKGKNNRSGVEIYKTARYFICTGKTIAYEKVIENQSAIDYIVDKYFGDFINEESREITNTKIYSPYYQKPQNGKIKIRPQYPVIREGGRNISLTSLAGQLHSQGYKKREIYKELLYCNSVACKPPLSQNEIGSIVESVTRYRR